MAVIEEVNHMRRWDTTWATALERYRMETGRTILLEHEEIFERFRQCQCTEQVLTTLRSYLPETKKSSRLWKSFGVVVEVMLVFTDVVAEMGASIVCSLAFIR